MRMVEMVLALEGDSTITSLYGLALEKGLELVLVLDFGLDLVLVVADLPARRSDVPPRRCCRGAKFAFAFVVK